jgi:hypothetical protein
MRERGDFMREPVVGKKPDPAIRISWLWLLYLPLMLWAPEPWGYGLMAMGGFLLFGALISVWPLKAIKPYAPKTTARGPAPYAMDKQGTEAVRDRPPVAWPEPPRPQLTRRRAGGTHQANST